MNAPGPMKRIDRYVARLVAVPLAATVLVTVGLLFLQYLPVLMNRVAQQGGGTRVVWEMLGMLVPEYVDLALPISLLIGVTMAFRRLALDHEMDVIAASGISPLRLMRVPLLCAAVAAVLTMLMMGYVQPLGARAYDRLAFLVRTGGFGLPLEVDSFNRISEGVTLRVGARDPDSGRLRDIFVQSSTSAIHPFVLTALQGAFVKAPASHSMLLRLRHGRLVMEKGETDIYRVMDFDQYDVPIAGPAASVFRPHTTDEQEMTLPELVRGWSDRSLSRHSRHLVHGELQRRAILSVVPFLLPFLAFAVHRPPIRSRSSMGLVTGLFLLVLLIKGLDFGVQFTEWMASPIQIGMFLAFAGLVLRLYYISTCKAGGEPLSLVYSLQDRLRRSFPA